MSDEATNKRLAELSAKVLQGARNAAIIMGVMPPHWAEAIVLELSALISSNPNPEECLETTIETLRALFKVAIEEEGEDKYEDDEEDSNPRIGIRVIMGPREPDEVSELLARTIGKIER